MPLHAFCSGANVIALEKDGQKYGMTCAWSTMLDYDYLGMLLGSQSTTGNSLKVGDVVGVSALSKSQKEIALIFGESHSDENNKFSKVNYSQEGSALLIIGAKVNMICEVVDIKHILPNSDDNFVILKVIKSIQNKDKDFLLLEDVYPLK